jgi:hypothetical protein
VQKHAEGGGTNAQGRNVYAIIILRDSQITANPLPTVISIQLTHRPFETRVGAIQNGKVTILKDGDTHDYYVDHISPTEDGPAVIDSRRSLGPNLLLSALDLRYVDARSILHSSYGRLDAHFDVLRK